MKKKIVPYGETHPVRVITFSKNVMSVHATDIKEGFILFGHGLKNISKGDEGKIVFEKGGPMGGYWNFYPNKKS